MEKEEIERIEQMKEKAEELLKNNEDYEDYELSYILIDKNDKDDAIAIAFDYDSIAQIDLKTNKIYSIAEFAYNIDGDIFGELEENKEIGYMSMDCHEGCWIDIEAYYPTDLEYKKGMQEYLKYCKENGITKERLEKEVGYKGEDAMKYYKEKNKMKER